MSNLYLYDLGIVCSLGKSKQQVANSLFNSDAFLPIITKSTLISGRTVPEIAIPFDLPDLSENFSKLNSRNSQLLSLALDQIAESITKVKNQYGSHRIGVVLGTSSSGMYEGESAYIYRIKTGNWPENYSYSQQEVANPSLFTAQYFNITGPSYTISTACSSGAKALCASARLIEAGICDAVITGGADTLCDLIRNGFDSLELLSEQICNPFSQNRNGITLGEGAAVFLMTRENLTNSEPIKFLGYGESSDAYHISAPEPTGKGVQAAIEQALKMANLLPEDIDYINLHGTGSNLNDYMESTCMHRIFGSQTPCSSTKALTGHTLGASGAIEAAFLWLCLQEEKSEISLPAHVWDNKYDPELAQIHFTVSKEKIVSRRGVFYLMSNSFAFGGSNVSLILSKSIK